jgi:hypothetical protein
MISLNVGTVFFIFEKICFKFDKQISNLKKVPTRFPMEGLSTNTNFVIKVHDRLFHLSLCDTTLYVATSQKCIHTVCD